MGNTYSIEVGIEEPCVGIDDTFEVQVELTDEEICEIIQGGIQLLQNDRVDIETYEYIEVLSKTAYSKLKSITESIASKKWGDKMLVSNSARYIYFLPEEIKQAIFNSKEVVELYSLIAKRESLSNIQFREDCNILFDNYNKGRWQNRLLPDPHWNNQPFRGIWNGHSVNGHKINCSKYEIHCNIEIIGIKTKISYSVVYLQETSELELFVNRYDDQVVKVFDNVLCEEGYFNIKRNPIGNPVYSFVIYADGGDSTKYVCTYMNILDKITKL